jgi:hypothetical protein
VIGGPGHNDDIDVGIVRLPHDLSFHRLGGDRIEIVDAIVGLLRAHERIGIAGRPGKAGLGDRVRMDRAIGIDEAVVGQQFALRPDHRIFHRLPRIGDILGPVEVRGRIEIAGKNGRNPFRRHFRQSRRERLQHIHAIVGFEL